MERENDLVLGFVILQIYSTVPISRYMGEPISFSLSIIQLVLWAALIGVITKFFYNRYKAQRWLKFTPLLIACFGAVVFAHDIWHFIDFRRYCEDNAGFRKIVPVTTDELHYEGPSWYANALIASAKISSLSVAPRSLIQDVNIDERERVYFAKPQVCIRKFTGVGEAKFFDERILANSPVPICLEERNFDDPPRYQLQWHQVYSYYSEKFWRQGRAKDFAIRLIETKSGVVLSEYIAISDKRGWIERIITGGWHGRFTCINKRPKMQRTYFFAPYFWGPTFNETKFLNDFLDRAILPVED